MRLRKPASALLAGVVLAAVVGPAMARSPFVEPSPSSSSVKVEVRPTSGARSFGTQATSSLAANGRLVYVRSTHGLNPNRIWTMRPDGSDMQPLVTDVIGWGAMFPAVSPGGQFVAFAQDMTADEETKIVKTDLFVVPIDGSAPARRLTNTTAAEFDPDWTPDGARIVFSSDRTGNFDIYSMRIDGSDVRRLTNDKADDVTPSVSPDGSTIAFASDRAGNFQIYTMRIDGTNVQRWTIIAGDDRNPDWVTRDPTEVVYHSDRSGDFDIFRGATTTTNAFANITSDPEYDDYDPVSSPDSSQMLFWSAPVAGGDSDLWMYTWDATTFTSVGATPDDEWGPDWQPIPAFPLVDAKFSTFKTDIEWVYNEGITKGCGPERYCPDDPVTREQMAIFLDRALKLPTTTTDYFTDDTGKTGEAAINRVAAAGITSGCATGMYCPTDTVTRGAMASFLARAFHLPATTTDYFTDDNGTTHEANINRVKAAGITSGCTPTTYCPAADVTRGQMAAFLRRALE